MELQRVTALSVPPRQKAVRMSEPRYEAFRLADTQRTVEIDIAMHNPASVKDACEAALVYGCVYHKEHIVVRETNDRGVALHVFAVKRQSAPNYVYDTETHDYRRLHKLYAAPVCVIGGVVLA